MNQLALSKTRKKHHAWIQYLNIKDRQDYQHYTIACNNATHTIRKTRKEYENNLVREIKVNNKAFWSYVNSRQTT